MKKSILVVDDDPQIRESLGKVLRAEGYEVLLAADAQEVADRSYATRSDLVLLDLNLPGRSGWDIFGDLTSSYPFLPIIIITGGQSEHELAAAAGAGALMEKPLNVPLLLNTINQSIAERPDTHLERLAGLRRDTRSGRRPDEL